jgi:hypothetical protein
MASRVLGAATGLSVQTERMRQEVSTFVAA